MSQDFLAVLEYMEKEKGIDRKRMLEAIEQALLSAARKSFGPAKDLRVSFDPKNGVMKCFASLRVVEKVTNPVEEVGLQKARQQKIMAQLGEMVEIEVTPKDFGRIAAQIFKQTINQNLRSIEKTMIFDEFKDREGDIVAGVVRRFERSDVIIDLGKFEAVIPSKERVPTEEYTPGERIRALVLAVDSAARGPQIILSRSHPNFVRRLFELEVNELHDGSIEIKGMAREAGYRTKIAVWSKDEKIDPVGACVGMRGSRVKNIVRELNNEKIDLFRWSPDIKELIIEALKPAKLKNLIIDNDAKRAKAFVDEENLSLAIGRRGQNARLTSKLTGWEIDIEKDEVHVVGFEEKKHLAAEKLATQLGIAVDLAEKLIQAGFTGADVILSVEASDIKDALPDLDDETIQSLRSAAESAEQTTAS
ncbi:MAG: transcription termination factor NusA [Candidatus Methylacidiphilales bacterium]|nr:transcription termination factor NusA [Candidatus Methylacidiphilales bacterium]